MTLPERASYYLLLRAAAALKWDAGKRAAFLICALIFFVSLGVRLIGIGWGLKNDYHNQSLHPDEPLIFDFVHKSHVFRGPAEREYYNYGTLFYGALRAANSIGVAFGGVARPESLELKDVETPKQWNALNDYVSQCHEWGRYLVAMAGAATCMLVFLIMRRWTGDLPAIAGAALLTFSPAHVEHSRFQTVDVLSLFFVALTTLAAVRLLRPDLTDSKHWIREVALSSALAGFAASTRYSDALMVLAVMAAIVLRRPAKWPVLLILAQVVTVLGFALTTPGVLTDSSYFWTNFQYQASHANSGHGLVFVGRPTGFVFHVYQLMMGINVLGVAIGLAGLGAAAVKRHKWAWVLLAFFIPYYISIGSLQVMFLRYGFPLYVGVACGFSYAISVMHRRTNRFWVPAAVAAFAIASFENPQGGIRGTLLFTKWMTSIDPRDEAAQFLKEQAKVTPGLEVGVFGSSPWFWSASVIKDSQFLKFQPQRVQEQYLSATRDPKVVPFVNQQVPLYATYSSYEVEEPLRLRETTGLAQADQQVVGTGLARISALNRLYMPVTEFGAGGPGIHDLAYIRPRVFVLKRRDSQ